VGKYPSLVVFVTITKFLSESSHLTIVFFILGESFIQDSSETSFPFQRSANNPSLSRSQRLLEDNWLTPHDGQKAKGKRLL
jgi:hypothetical protein